MSRLTRDKLILILVPLIGVAFSLYEWGGITNAPWNSISFYAFHDVRIAIAVSVLALVGLIIFEVWWWRHIHKGVPR